MHYLFLRILFNTAFAQLLKVAQTRDGQVLPAALVNYFVATLLSLLLLVPFPAPPAAGITLWLGTATGCTYAVSLLGLETALRVSGVSIAVAVLQLSVLVPTVASILFFHERPSALQFVGIAAAIIALPLLSRSRATEDHRPVPLRDTLLIIFLLFFVSGCSNLMIKVFQVQELPNDRLAFTITLFAASTVVTGVAVFVRRIPWGRSAWSIGTLIGLANVAQLEATLAALAILPAVIVFPVASALTVALTTLLSIRFWGERLETRAWIGIGLAVLAAALLNL